jgi:hypothetical protein
VSRECRRSRRVRVRRVGVTGGEVRTVQMVARVIAGSSLREVSITAQWGRWAGRSRWRGGDKTLDAAEARAEGGLRSKRRHVTCRRRRRRGHVGGHWARRHGIEVWEDSDRVPRQGVIEAIIIRTVVFVACHANMLVMYGGQSNISRVKVLDIKWNTLAMTLGLMKVRRPIFVYPYSYTRKWNAQAMTLGLTRARRPL